MVDVEAAVEAIAGAASKPQAVVLASLEAPNVKFIQLYRQHPRADPNCSFVLMSVGATPSFAAKLGVQHWHDLYFFHTGILLTDTHQ